MQFARNFAVGLGCAALVLWAGAAAAQEKGLDPGAALFAPGASAAPVKSANGAEWRTAWQAKWAANRKAELEAWRKRWAQKAKQTAPPAAPKASAPAAATQPAPKSEPKAEVKAAAKAAPASASPVPTAPPKPDAKAAPAPSAAPVAPQKNAAASANSATTANSAPKSAASAAAPVAPPAKAAAPPVQNPAPAAAPVLAAPKPADSLLSETRPDPAAEIKKTADKPLDSPLGAIGDGGRMFFCLIPTVLVMVGALHLLRRFQEKNGRSPAFARMGTAPKSAPKPAPTAPKPGLLQSLLGGINRNETTERGSIRIIESVPIGGSNLHLIEVRGRTLLLGASASGVNLLTEIEEADSLVNNEFRLLLEQAAGDMDSLGLTDDALPASLLIGTLDDPLRDANRAITRGTRRLRTVQETEAAWEQGEK